jgi:hypothetical protein
MFVQVVKYIIYKVFYIYPIKFILFAFILVKRILLQSRFSNKLWSILSITIQTDIQKKVSFV